MRQGLYSLDVLVNGRPVRELEHEAKSFVEAREGTQYTIRFRNDSTKRVMVVCSVDGVDALGGKIASEADNGYLVDAASSVEIKGYRISKDEVAAFRFAGGKLSYAATVGGEKKDGTREKTEQNNGVIGVRVFCEKADPTVDAWKAWASPARKGHWEWHEDPNWGLPMTYTCDSAHDLVYRSPAGTQIHACSSQASYTAPNATTGNVLRSCSTAPNFDLGTTWGSKIEDKVREVPFERGNLATELTIYYASRKELEAYGIDLTNTKKVVAWPKAFEGAYCKPPEGYRG